MMDRLVKVVCQLNLEFQDVVLVINFYSIKDGDHLAAIQREHYFGVCNNG